MKFARISWPAGHSFAVGIVVLETCGRKQPVIARAAGPISSAPIRVGRRRGASLLACREMSEESEPGKQQFNIYLPPGLIRRVKHAAVDQASSLSKLVEDALTAHLDRLDEGSSR
jgi:hypothetical protein